MINSPYPGLRPFTQDETGIFFGRDRQIDQLLDKLGHAHFIAVVGVSGCGKSSLVRAGLLPALKAGFLAEAGVQWRIATMHPGDHPMHNLASALLEPSALGKERADLSYSENLAFLLTTLRRGSLGLIEALEETPLPEKTNLLILVDQFEEIFWQSVKYDINEAIAFVSLLLASVERQRHIFVVITMRSDFLGDCPVFLRLPEAINDSQFLTPRLTRDQCRAAIQGPAAVFGNAVEPRLINHLLNEMGDDPDQLPVLQHCLMRIWQKALERNGKKAEDIRPAYKTKSNQGIEISWEDYEAVGKLQNAISQHGEEAIEEVKKLGNHTERTTESLFRALVEVVSNRRDMRRAISLNQIASETAIPKSQLKDVAEIFCDPRFCFIQIHQGQKLTFESKLCITHESLIRQWQRMNEWVEQEAKSAEIYCRLEQTACRWNESKAALWTTPDLEIALTWKKQEKPTEQWAKRYGEHFDLAIKFLDASRRRKIWMTCLKVAIPLFIIILAVSLTIWALRERSRAERARIQTEHALIVAEERREEAEEQKLWALEAEKKAKEAQKEAELNSSRFREMVTATFGFLSESRQNKEFFGWVEETLTIERLIPALSVMIDSSESLDEEQKKYWKSELSAMTEEQKVSLLDILGREAAEKARRKEVFRIRQVVLKDASGVTVPLVNKICVIKLQERVTIEIDVDNPYNQSYEVEYTASRGTVESDATYVAPNMPGGSDIVTIKVVDIETGEIMAQESIIIKITE